MRGHQNQKPEQWFERVVESLKKKDCGTINCRSRLDPRYAVGSEINKLISLVFKNGPRFGKDQNLNKKC